MLYGVRFDAERLEIEGKPVPLVPDLASDPASAAGRFDVSSTGMLAFSSGSGVQAWSLSWLDSTGGLTPLLSKPVMYYSPRFSPDGRRLAVSIDSGKGMDISIHDFDRDTTSPVTFNAASNTDAVWTSDGTHFVFRSRGSGTWGLWWMRADGVGSPQALTSGEIQDLSANALSPQGDWLIYAQVSSGTGSDLWVMPIDRSDPDRPKPGQPQPFLKTPASEVRPAFSHDGRWVAYSSNESGIMQVYVRTFEPSASGAEGKWRISSVEGIGPIWSRNGRQLFYHSQNRIMVADFVVRGRSFVASQPRVWSTQPLLATGFTNLDLAPDGRFAVVPAPNTLAKVRMTVLLNFFDELRRRIP